MGDENEFSHLSEQETMGSNALGSSETQFSILSWGRANKTTPNQTAEQSCKNP